MKTEIVCPKCGENIVIERPEVQKRGQLAGLNLTEMTLEQLKREVINSKSVLYKATKRNASEETIAKNQSRVVAVVAERASRGVVVTATAAESDAENEAVYNEDLVSEV